MTRPNYIQYVSSSNDSSLITRLSFQFVPNSCHLLVAQRIAFPLAGFHEQSFQDSSLSSLGGKDMRTPQ